MIETYKTVFPHLYIIKGSKSLNSYNYIFIATESSTQENAENILRKARALQKAKKFDIDLPMISWLFAYYTDYEGNGEILTDDFAPVNMYRHMKAE